MQVEKTLETIALPEGNLNNDAATAEFRKKIDESKIQMQAEIPQAKRGRGRPRKNPLPQTPAQSSAAGGATASNSGVAEPMPPPDLTNLLVPPLIGLSKIPASYFSVAEIALTEEEAGICAQSLNQLLQVLVPDVAQIDPRTAAIVGFCTTVTSIGFSKYQIYQAKIKTLPNPAPPSAKEVPVSPAGASPFPTEHVEGNRTPAENYFSKQRAV